MTIWTPDRIRALRKRYGEHQDQFARRFRLKIGTVQSWEQGKSIPIGPAQILLEQLEERLEESLRNQLQAVS